MAPPLGHETNKKLKTLELKKEAFRQYLEHLSKGKSKKSWYFEHPDLTLLWQTMETYIREEPEIFNPIQIEMAHAKGYQYWEQVAETSAEGKNQANTASLQMVMRNKFGWDKQENINKDSKETLVEKFLTKLDQLDCKDNA